MRKLLIFILLFSLALPELARAADIYFGESSAGSDTGADAANRHSAAWFNANQTSGNTYHVCGTVSTAIAFLVGGSSGNPVQLVFETGAKFSRAYWPLGYAIRIHSLDYITIDGMATGNIGHWKNHNFSLVNGIIETTDNGVGMSNQQDGGGIWLENASHITIKNLKIGPLFVRTQNSDDTHNSISSIGAYCPNSNYTDLVVQNCWLTDSYIGIDTAFSAGTPQAQNFTITDVYFQDMNWEIHLGGNNTGAKFDNMTVSGCRFGNYSKWDFPSEIADRNHHNGIIIVPQDNNSGQGYTHGIKIYDCLFADDFGERSSGSIFANGGDFDCSMQIFNCIFLGLDSWPSNQFITVAMERGTTEIYNNTFIGAAGQYASAISVSSQYGGTELKTYTIKNNISMNCIFQYDHDIIGYNVTLLSNYNLIGGTIHPSKKFFFYDGEQLWSDWNTLGFDLNGIYGSDPLLTGTYYPGASSPARGAGVNLTSLGITELNSDADGNARPSSGAWDMGALNYVNTIFPPARPRRGASPVSVAPGF